MNKKLNFVIIGNFITKVSSVVVFDINIFANITLIGKKYQEPRNYQENIMKVKNLQTLLWTSIECAVTFGVVMQLLNNNTPAFVSCDTDLTETWTRMGLS